MAERLTRPGYLRYKCKSCDALIKAATPDPLLALRRVVANNGEIMHGFGFLGLHENCDGERAGITHLVGCTFSEEEPN